MALKIDQLTLFCFSFYVLLTPCLFSNLKLDYSYGSRDFDGFQPWDGYSGREPVKTDRPVVSIKDGMVRGFKMNSISGREYYAFTSIPFARPPLGKLRFERPFPNQPWRGIREGPKDLTPCVQFQSLLPFAPNDTYGSEDCLYLSVFTPQPVRLLRLPVMVFIHGGAWRTELPEAGAAVRSRYMMDEDIILVVIRYRLGALGFLSLEHPGLPGNQGLKDQGLALHWVYNNIDSFGGDPNRITIFGNSAGGASVHYLLTSPVTKHLIQGGISESGLATALWAFSAPGVARYRAKRCAEYLNCPTKPDSELVLCLKTKTPEEITDCEKRLFIRRDVDPVGPYTPVLEMGPDAFVRDSPYNLPIEKPWIMGVNPDEGAFKTIFYLARPELLESFEEMGVDILPEACMYTNTTTYRREISEDILREYADSNLTDIWTDCSFLFSTIAAKHLSVGPLYFYLFNHRGAVSWTDVGAAMGNTNFGDLGVCHADEVMYLFNYEDDLQLKKTPQDRLVSKRLIKLWTNFAKYGKPASTLEWPEYNDFTRLYLAINTDGNQICSNLWPRRTEFWRRLPVRNIMESYGL